VRSPDVPFARALGVGLDLRYGDPHGFIDDGGLDRLAPRVSRFLTDHAGRFGYAFFSFQPRDRALLDARDYLPVWDRLFAEMPRPPAVGMHHTMLNLGAIDDHVDRGRVIDVTNALIERYDLRWVNEDVGIWAIDGKLLPYPLPPILTAEGLDAAVRHVDQVQRALAAPLVLEFPGFSEGVSFTVGDLDAYDFFRELAERTGAPVTLDTGCRGAGCAVTAALRCTTSSTGYRWRTASRATWRAARSSPAGSPMSTTASWYRSSLSCWTRCWRGARTRAR
jgi:hypothetical protein